MSDPQGYLCIVLHAHLPYVRHPEYPDFLEEDWFYEAVTETYVPLLDIMERLAGEKIRSASPCPSPRRCATCCPTIFSCLVTASGWKSYWNWEKKKSSERAVCRRRFKKRPPCIWASSAESKKFLTVAGAGS
jgi:hypothetical protein